VSLVFSTFIALLLVIAEDIFVKYSLCNSFLLIGFINEQQAGAKHLKVIYFLFK